jgi:hypothetical protein
MGKPATPKPIKDWPLTSLTVKLIKIEPPPLRRLPDGRGRHLTAQLFADTLRLITELRPPPNPASA